MIGFDSLKMKDTDILIPTSTIGSYAPPSWLCVTLEAIGRGEFGETDINETFDDAVRTAIADQERAGVDIITEGEMRRQDFVLGFYERLIGLEQLPAPRTQGPDGHDNAANGCPLFRSRLPMGLGILAEFEFAKNETTKPLKVTCPGPFTLSGRIQTGGIYKERLEVAYACAEIINTELRQLVAAGAEFIQLDEPSYAVYPDRPEEFVKLFNHTVEGLGRSSQAILNSRQRLDCTSVLATIAAEPSETFVSSALSLYFRRSLRSTCTGVRKPRIGRNRIVERLPKRQRTRCWGLSTLKTTM